MADIPSQEEIIELDRQAATPLDFEQLEKEGIIEKKGAWFKVKKPLPEHVSRQVKAVKTDCNLQNYVAEFQNYVSRGPFWSVRELCSRIWTV
jgi:hypothetical protein